MMRMILTCCLLLFSLTGFAKQWTVLMYFSGDNNLSNVLKIQMEALIELEHSDDINILIQFDGDRPGDSLRLELGVELIVHQQNLQYDMGKEETLVDFVRWGRENYPAEKYVLVMNGHGRGILNLPVNDGAKGDGAISLASSPDDLSNSVFNDEVLARQLELALEGEKIDLFIYSSCLMGNLESLTTMSSVAKYILASEYLIYLEANYGPTTILGEGISLKEMIRALSANPSIEADQLGAILVDRYNLSYKDFKVFDFPGMSHHEEASLALYDMAGLQEVENLLVDLLYEVLTQMDLGQFDLDLFYVKILDAPKVNFLGYIDLAIFVDIVDSLLDSAVAKRLLQILTESLSFISAKTLLYLPPGTGGVSLFFPPERPAYGLASFESLLSSYKMFQFNERLPLARLIDRYLDYTDKNARRIIEEIIIEIVKNKNAQGLEEHLFFLKMEVYLQKESKRVVREYYKKIRSADYHSYYFKRHLGEVKEILDGRVD